MRLNYINQADHIKSARFTWVLSLFLAFGFAANLTTAYAHGGEDHGEAKPATTTTGKGTVTRTAQLGDFEIMLKHSPLEPDTAASGRLFITRFATNEPVGDAGPAIEIESAAGAVTEIPIEKTDAVGSYSARIPALPEGTYTMRAKAAAGGKTNTATFSGVEIAPHTEEEAAVGGSWAQTALMVAALLAVLGLFGGLAYLARRTFNKPLGEETVSA